MYIVFDKYKKEDEFEEDVIKDGEGEFSGSEDSESDSDSGSDSDSSSGSSTSGSESEDIGKEFVVKCFFTRIKISMERI